MFRYIIYKKVKMVNKKIFYKKAIKRLEKMLELIQEERDDTYLLLEYGFLPPQIDCQIESIKDKIEYYKKKHLEI